MGPIRGQTRPLPVAADIVPQHIDAKLNASIHNRFDVEVVDATTGEVRQRAQAENVILDQMWAKTNTYYVFYNWNKYIHIGSGTGTPTSSDTKLFNFIGGIAASTTTEKVIDQHTFSVQQKISLTETQYVGSTITEIGVASSATDTDLRTHAMLQDMNGNSISIVKTATDIINIYATIFLRIAEQNGILIFPYSESSFGTPHMSDFVRCFLGLGYNSDPFYSGQLQNGDMYSSNGPSASGFSTVWTPASKKLVATLPRIAASAGNYNGFNSITFTCKTGSYDYAKFMQVDSSVFSNTAILSETIGTGDGTTKDFSTLFPVSSGATIYINGVQNSAVTVDTGDIIKPESSRDFFRAFKLIDGAKYYVSYASNNFMAGGELISYFENTHSGVIGISSIASSKGDYVKTIELSNDLTNWVAVTPGSSIDERYQYYKYLRVTCSSVNSNPVYMYFTPVMNKTLTSNVHFATAPASGAVITADYHTSVIAKDVNHVFDFSLSLQFGEYTA